MDMIINYEMIIKVFVQDKKVKADMEVLAEILQAINRLSETYTEKDGFYNLKISLFDPNKKDIDSETNSTSPLTVGSNNLLQRNTTRI